MIQDRSICNWCRLRGRHPPPGRFRPGDTLPGTRALAEHLGVNRNTALAAYKELEAEGWITVSPDNGSFVARDLPFCLDPDAGIAAGDSASWKSATARTDPFYQPAAETLDQFRLLPDGPDLRLTPTAAIHRAYGRILKLHPERLLQPRLGPSGPARPADLPGPDAPGHARPGGGAGEPAADPGADEHPEPGLPGVVRPWGRRGG